MAKPFKFRYVNELAGFFVLATIATLVAGAALAAKTQRWFIKTEDFTVQLPRSGSGGLRPGSQVTLLGTEIGSVSDVQPPQADGDMRAIITVRSDFGQFIRADSKATITKEFGVAGDASLDISRGVGDALGPGDSIPTSNDTSMTDKVQQTLDLLQKQVVPTIQKVQTAVTAYTLVANDLHDPNGHLQQAIGRLDAIASDLQNGKGLAGRIITDDAMANHVAGIVANADQTSTSLAQLSKSLAGESQQFPKILADLDQAIVEARSTLLGLQRTTDALPSVVLQTQQTELKIQKLTDSLQNSWLLGGGGASSANANTQRIDPDAIPVGD